MTDKKEQPIRDRLAKAISGETAPKVDADMVRDLAKLLEETGLTELEIEQGGVRVRVARGTMVAAAAAPAMPVAAAGPEVQPEPARRPGTVVTSPMVGTVYLSPQPGAPVFVKIGDAVTDGTLCIIEAMKTMNPVPSPAAGRVVEIYVRDGQPVEFGEPLMLIE
ncbi:MAG TPA: acetyl-CoA carboxylase biotin carboxyl carrier protein [Micropepsaceae bacterium]|nr:acetyl-CoA carboxylase biotin carboxyl carrier protein [Micropepsaceae bacterium]